MLRKIAGVVALLCMVATCVLLMPKTAAAQDQGATYYTYVSQWAVPRAQWAAFEKQDEASVPHMKTLVADGTIVSWGNEEVRVHQDDGITHAEWFVATSRANLLKALESQWTIAVNPGYVSATRHFDFFLRTLAHGAKPGSSGTGYLRVASYQAKPGQEEAVVGVLMGKIKPFLDAELSKGNLVMYNVDMEEIHTLGTGAYDLAMIFPDGAAMDNFYADYDAAAKADPTVGELTSELSVSKEHRDSLGRVTAYQNK